MAARVVSPPTDSELKVDVKVEEDHSKPALTPPTSEGTKGNRDDSSSELSDLEPEDSPKLEPKLEPQVEPKLESVEEIVPDHYYEGGKVPVFKPVRESTHP